MARRTRPRSATRPRTGASACTSRPPSGCSTTSRSGRRSTSSLRRLSRGMSSSLRLAAQALALLVVAGLVGLFAWNLTSDDGKNIPSDVQQGKTPAAPLFTLPRLEGDGQVALSSFAEKVVVLNFWASWCIPCKREASRFQEVWERHRRDGVVVLGVDTLDFDGDGR